MYGFKVMVTTLILIMIGLLMYVYYKADRNGKIIALAIMLVNVLSAVAIWG